MKKIYVLIIALISLPFISQENSEITLPELGDRVSGAVSSSEEKMIGEEFLKQIYFQAPLISDPLIQEYTELLTYRLSEFSEVKDRDFTILLIDDNSLNAFAAPGGIIGVNGGLFLNAKNEAQFSSVMAHELAHLSQRHFARNILNAKDRSMTSSLVLVSSIAIALISNNANAMAVGPAIMQAQNLRYSRLFEKEADRVGFNNLIFAGYDPNSMGEMFEIMNRLRRLSGETPPEFLLTHPLSQSRINDAYNAAEGVDDVNKKKNTLEYSLIRSRLKIHYEKIPSNSLRFFKSEYESVGSDENIYGLALAYQDIGEYKQSIDLIDYLIKKYPKNLFLNTSKVEMLSKQKKFNAALDLADKFLEISPKNYPLSVVKSKVLLEMKEYFMSEEIIRDQLIRRNDDPQLWLLLSDLQRTSKNIVGYHQSRAEYFILLGQNTEALNQLEFALKLTKNNFQASERIMNKIVDIKKEIGEFRGL